MLDQDRYPDRDRDRDRRGDRSGRRDRGAGAKDRHREGFENVPTGPRAERKAGAPPPPPSSSGDVTMAPPPTSMPPPPPPPSASASTPVSDTTSIPYSLTSNDSYTPPMTEKDLTAIRSRYLGVEKKRRKIRKMNDRKFVFDWDAQDDTLAEDSPLAMGSNRQGAQVMFGRGKLAGMDDGGGTGPRKSSAPAATTQLADAMERRMAAKAGYDDRHWTDKPLEEMKERDWRIFREDFSISARGGSFFH